MAAVRDTRAGAMGIAKGNTAASRRDGKLSEEEQLPSENSESMEADGGRRCIGPESSERVVGKDDPEDR